MQLLDQLLINRYSTWQLGKSTACHVRAGPGPGPGRLKGTLSQRGGVDAVN